MKKTIAGSILIFFIFSTLNIACAKSLELMSRSSEYTVEIKLDRNPPIVGDHLMEIKIKDIRGQVVSGQEIFVNYYMLPMPRMAPMNYTVPAKAQKNYYQASMNFIMSGPWVIAIKIPAAGKTRTIKFNIDVQ